MTDINMAVEDLQRELSGRVESYDMFIATRRGLTVEAKGGEVDALNVSQSGGIGLRVIQGGRLGFAFSTVLEGEPLREMVHEAIDGSDNVERDQYLSLPENRGEETPDSLSLYDGRIDTVSEEEKIAMALGLEAAAMGYDGRVRTVRKASYREGCRTTRIINSEGLDRGYKATFLSCSVTAVAEEGGDAQMGWEMGCGHHITDLDVVQVGESAAKRAVSMLGARSMSPVRCPLLIENTVVCELLDVLGASFLVENVEKGKSMLKGKRGERVAADSITIRDNGRLPGGWGSAPFDGEGAPTQTTPLVVEGVCHGYLSDTYWSKRSGEKATGNAVRSTFRNLPRVGTTNLSMEGRGPGVEALMSGMEKGFYVTDLLGVHTINAVTGEFSLGAAGYRVEGGKISFPVRGMALSGNLLELLLKIEEVGDDVRYRGSISAPSIVVSDMEVSGAT